MKITFVYNANSGRINTWLDIGHKILSPETYSCNLCSLTHGIFSEKDEWKKYREESEIELEFLHKDEFEKKYGIKDYSYPIVLKSEKNGSFDILLTTEEVNQLENLEALIKSLPKTE